MVPVKEFSGKAKWFSKMRLLRLGSFVLLMFGLATASADPGGNLRDAREAVRAYHIQSVTLERSMPREPQQAQQQERSRQVFGIPESSGYGAAGDAQSPQANQQADNQRRQGRMTPEERRALRRQIDEVGHDIYHPKR